jgi:hypothetical protein
MAACDVLYFDPTQAGQVRHNPAGQPLGPASDGWRPCSAPGQVWTDPELVLRFVCTTHRRQLVALHATGLADRIRWARDGLAIGTPTRPQGDSPCASTPPVST